MSIRAVPYYVLSCDCCGVDDYDAWVEASDAVSYTEEFKEVGDRMLCGACWRWPSDEEAEALGSDDAVPAHDVHPEVTR